MNIDTNLRWLPVYEALASEVRLRIIDRLALTPMNVKELAEALGLSSAIMTMHVRKLEKAGIIRTEMLRAKGGVQKLCSLAEGRIDIRLPVRTESVRDCHEVSVPVGHYTDCDITPTCGLATQRELVGQVDDPRYFLAPERMNAGILWFGTGFVEYKIPNYLLPNQKPAELEIALEVSSEAPGYNDSWPSDITFGVNGVEAGQWTSPGDYGGSRGACAPEWWPQNWNQYGLLKRLRINDEGTFMDGEPISPVTIGDIDIRRKQMSFRVAVKPDATHPGGATLFGSGFGNYGQDIRFKLYYA